MIMLKGYGNIDGATSTAFGAATLAALAQRNIIETVSRKSEST